MKLTKKDYETVFEGFFIIDCVVRKKDMLYFLLEQVYNEVTDTPPKREVRTRVVSCFDEPDPEIIWGYESFKGMLRLKAGVSLLPKEQFVGVSLNDHVYVIGSGDKGLEKDLVGGRFATGKDIGMRGGVSKLRTIDGALWLAGSGRTIGRRIGPDKWEWQDDIPYKSLMEDGGFLDIDGFSATDIYAAGGHGDVWHFDGNKWKPLAFPSNMTLETVCCAGDGYVYIGADSGTVYRGRAEKWERIHRGDMTLSYRDMVWHDGKVWATNDHGIWVIENGKVSRAAVPDKVRICSGHLSVGDGVLLLAGVYGAALYDGTDWRMIVDYNDLG